MAPTIGHGSWQQATTLAAAPAGCALRGSGGVGRRRARPPGRAPRLRRAAAAAGRGAARAVPPPAPAAGRPVARTIQLGQATSSATAASLWLPTHGSRLPGVVIVVGAAPLGRQDPQAMQVARAFARAGRAVLVPDLALRTSTLSAADLERIGSAFDALATLPRVDPQRVGLLGISWAARWPSSPPPPRRLPPRSRSWPPSGLSTTWQSWP